VFAIEIARIDDFFAVPQADSESRLESTI